VENIKRIAELEELLRQAEERLERCSENDNFLRQTAELQRNMLPDTVPEIEGYSLAAMMRPAREVGGDFYDYMPVLLGPKTIGLLVADVTDKGMPASFYMANTHGILHSGLSLMAGSSVEKLLRWANLQLLQTTSRNGMFVTLTFGILDSGNNTFRYARAGHTQPYMFDWEGKTVFRGSSKPGQPLGLLPSPKLDVNTLNIPPGGIIALYSDGLADETDPENCAFGIERLEELIAGNRTLSALKICEGVMGELDRYREGTRQFDDCTIMIVKREN
jgi:phosphoserine phosphatase RsbU/P